MKKPILCVLAGLLLVSTAGLAKKDERINLRLNLKPGDNYRYQISATMHTSMVSGDSKEEEQKEAQDINLEMEFELECIDATESGTFLVRIGYTAYKIK